MEDNGQCVSSKLHNLAAGGGSLALIGAGVVSVESTFARGFPLGSRAYHGEMATGREQ